MKPWHLFFITSLVGCSTVTGADRLVSKGTGFPYLGSYQAEPIDSLEELPPPLRQAIEQHVRGRVGEDFYPRLRFSAGQRIDHARLLRDEPLAAGYRWEVPGIILHFEFRYPTAGLERYVAEMSLRSDGSILKPIELPSFSTAPWKLQFTGLDSALEKVSRLSGQAVSALHADVAYDAEHDSLVWQVTATTRRDTSAAYFTRYDVDMHTGDVRRQWDGTADF